MRGVFGYVLDWDMWKRIRRATPSGASQSHLPVTVTHAGAVLVCGACGRGGSKRDSTP